MTTSPLVSVAMITYNHERFVAQAIESVLAQRTDFAIELVIADDASPDKTACHIHAMEARAPGIIRATLRPSNVGMHRNLEGVLSQCRGEFVAFLEGDDYWTSNSKLQKQVDILRKCKDAVGTFHTVTIVDSQDFPTGKIFPEQCVPEVITKDLLIDNCIPTPSVMVRREALTVLPNRFRELKMRDWPMWVYASLRGPWICLSQALAAYRHHEGGVWSPLDCSTQFVEVAKLFELFRCELPKPFSALAHRRLVQYHLEALEKALESGELDRARSYSRNVLSLFPYPFGEGRRLASLVWEAFSPSTHGALKRLADLMRQT